MFIQGVSKSALQQTKENDQEGHIYFQHDGVTSNYLGGVREYLNTRFPDRRIGRATPIAWTPLCPDLTSLDFFLWWFLKDRVFVPPSLTNVAELRTRIIASVTSQMTWLVTRNWPQVGHLPHYQWKSHWTTSKTKRKLKSVAWVC
jgi:hypothetical protein